MWRRRSCGSSGSRRTSRCTTCSCVRRRRRTERVDLRALLRDAPPFHVDEGLRPRSLQASDEVLETIAAAVQPGWRTLETGAGLSTVVFALRGAEHVCITPA